MANHEEIEFEMSSGNVFADLGLPNPEIRQARVRLAVLLNRALEQQGLTQLEAARLLGITQPKVSALQNYKLEGFSVQKLMQLITVLGFDVVIQLRPKASTQGEARVIVEAAA